jgi:hypothetical protein
MPPVSCSRLSVPDQQPRSCTRAGTEQRSSTMSDLAVHPASDTTVRGGPSRAAPPRARLELPTAPGKEARVWVAGLTGDLPSHSRTSIPQPRRPPSPTQDIGDRGETSGYRARSFSESPSPAIARFRLIADAGVSSPASETSEIVAQQYGISPPLGDGAPAFFPGADRERSSRCAVGDVRGAGVASRSPAVCHPCARVLPCRDARGRHRRGRRLVLWGVVIPR